MRLRKIAVLAAGLLAAGGLAFTVSPAAHATTSTCTNIATPISPPIGCGGIYLPMLGTPIQPNSTSLTLTAASPAWNSGVTVAPYNASDASQDFTVYEVCDFNNPGPFNGGIPTSPSETNPCGANGTPVVDPLSGRHEFVAEATPGGQHLGSTKLINDPDNLCLSVEAVRDGPRTWWGGRALRWHVVLRFCNTYGAHFTEGTPDPTAVMPPNSRHGIGGVVNFANKFQTWSPIPANGGYVLGNNALSNNFANHPFVLDKRGGGLGSGPVIAYPENDQNNQIWKVIGCTNPVTSLTPGFYNCP